MRDEKGRFIKGTISPFRGHKHTVESRFKQSKSHKGKSITWDCSHQQTEETKEKIRLASLEHWNNPEYRKKVLSRRVMSGLEKKFLHYVQKHNLPYKFVGNGEFFIENKNPDFVNVNGEKKAIEVYWARHKEEFREGLDAWKEERTALFNRYGWDVIYFEGREVNEKNILRQLTKNIVEKGGVLT